MIRKIAFLLVAVVATPAQADTLGEYLKCVQGLDQTIMQKAVDFRTQQTLAISDKLRELCENDDQESVRALLKTRTAGPVMDAARQELEKCAVQMNAMKSDPSEFTQTMVKNMDPDAEPDTVEFCSLIADPSNEVYDSGVQE